MDLRAARYIDKWVGLGICAALFAFERTTGPLRGRQIAPRRATTPPPLRRPPRPAPRRILAIKFYGLGNVVMLLPVIQALQRRYQEAEIDFLTLEGGNVALLARSPI